MHLEAGLEDLCESTSIRTDILPVVWWHTWSDMLELLLVAVPVLSKNSGYRVTVVIYRWTHLEPPEGEALRSRSLEVLGSLLLQ